MNFTITAPAERFLRRLYRLGDPGPAGGMRLVVTTGGCSGLAADFDVLAQPCAGDTVVDFPGLRLFLPVESRLLLDGATIDFAETRTETGLIVRPAGSSGAACGTSAPIPELISLAPPRGRG